MLDGKTSSNRDLRSLYDSMINIQSPVRSSSNQFHHSVKLSKALNHQQTKEQRSCHPSSTDLQAQNFSLNDLSGILSLLRCKELAQSRCEQSHGRLLDCSCVFPHQNHAFLPLLTAFGPIQGENSNVNTGGPTRCRTASK